MKKIIICFILINSIFLTACSNQNSNGIDEKSNGTNEKAIMTIAKKIEMASTFDEIVDCYDDIFYSEYYSDIPYYKYTEDDKNTLDDKLLDYLFSGDKLNGTYYYNELMLPGTLGEKQYGKEVKDEIVIHVISKDEVYFVPANMVQENDYSIPDMANATDYKYRVIDASGSKGGLVFRTEAHMTVDLIRDVDNYELTFTYRENEGCVHIYGVFPYQVDAKGNGTVPYGRDYYLDKNASEAASQKEYDAGMEEFQKKEELKKSKPKIGMTKSEVENCAWGEPDRKNVHTYSWGVTEQWVYDKKGYVYFEDGIVTSVSERE